MSSLALFTERPPVIVRQLKLEHASAYFDAVDANREHLSQFGDDTAAKYPNLKSVENSITHPLDPRKLRFGIWVAGVFAGGINARPLVDGQDPGIDKAEVGYWLDSRHTGRGYATIALRAVSSYAADHIGRPYAWVADGNDKSVAVLERAGFTHIRDSGDRHIFELLDTVE